VEFAASKELVDLATEGFDTGIWLIAADVVAVRLTSPFPMVVVGSATLKAARNWLVSLFRNSPGA
jgi:hypothetical protein